MNYKGNQIVGDKKYKKRFKNLKNVGYEINKKLRELDRQFLHAKILGFQHPRTGKKLLFESDLPNDLKNIINVLEKSN